MRLFACFSMLVLLGLGVPVLADEAPPERKPEAKAEGNKAPWSAKDVHDYWKKGRVFTYDVESEDGKGGSGTIEIEVASETDFTMTTTIKEPGKEAQAGKPRKRTFEQHLASVESDIKDAATSEETLAPEKAGKYACTVYTKKNEGSWQKFWLSTGLPGMPVKMEREQKRGEKRDYECWTLRSVETPRVALPWTSREIAAAWKDGAMFKYALESEGGAAGWMKLTISDVDAEGFTSVEEGEIEGKASKDAPRKFTWERFNRDIAPPKFGTKSEEGTLETPAGKFECTIYTTTEKVEGGESVSRVWICKSVVGPFVKMEQERKRGEQVDKMVMTLLEYKIGK